MRSLSSRSTLCAPNALTAAGPEATVATAKIERFGSDIALPDLLVEFRLIALDRPEVGAYLGKKTPRRLGHGSRHGRSIALPRTSRY
jgi:hypothetical protein